MFAIKDVSGPTGLASAAQQQGRCVAERLFSGLRVDLTSGNHSNDCTALFSTWIYCKDNTLKYYHRRRFLNIISFILSCKAILLSVDGPTMLWIIPKVASIGIINNYYYFGFVYFPVCYLPSVLSKSSFNLSTTREKNFLTFDFYLLFVYCTNYQTNTIYYSFLFCYCRRRPRIFKSCFLWYCINEYLIVGVHIIGQGTNELIQLGSILVHAVSTVRSVSNKPFSAFTLSWLYSFCTVLCHLCNCSRQFFEKNDFFIYLYL